MDEKNKLMSFISLIKKSGNLKSGEAICIDAIKNMQAYLVIVAEDASDNTKKRFSDKAGFRDIPLIYFSDKESLGRAIGKEFAASLAVCDAKLAQAFIDKYGRYLNGKNESV